MKRPIEFDLTDEEPTSQIYTCTVCGTTGQWGPEWSWYGSYRALDRGEPIVTCCSVACRKQHSADNAFDPKPLDAI